jgi:pimeloyl-ACP methyl ester carboxylesterase
MSTHHRWFRSGIYSLLGHVDFPEGSSADTGVGVVIVPPFGWEEVCSYRPLRFMAQGFAQRGIPALRYDLPGTGDSSGDAADAGLVDSWIRSVADAAKELRSVASVRDVTVIGIHLGAMLAMKAISQGADVRQMVLWGPASTGGKVLRELRAAANVERWEHLRDEDAPPQPMPGFESGGFLISPETQRALEELDVSSLPWRTPPRVLLLSRDDLPPDDRIVEGLHTSLPHVAIAPGHGYAAMMASPQESVCSVETVDLIADFIASDFHETPPLEKVAHKKAAIPLSHAAARPEHVAPRTLESVFSIDASSLRMFGILAEPDPAVPRNDYCLVYLNAGGVRHTGPNRMWVESARRWAARGVASLRLDLQGIGESDGEQAIDVPSLYRETFIQQIEIAIEGLRKYTGAKRFGAIGLCSGACWAFHAAARIQDVDSAILVNPSLLWWDPSVDRRRILGPLASGFTGWAEWSRVIRGGIERGNFQGAARKITGMFGWARREGNGYLHLGFRNMEQAWSALEQRRKRVTLVFREGEPLLAEMDAAGQLPPLWNSYARCIRIPNGGHTMRPLWAQKIVHDLIDQELDAAIQEAPAVSAPWPGETQTIKADHICANGTHL